MQYDRTKTLRDMEVEYVRQALEHHGGNKTHAAAALDISTRTIRNWIKQRECLRSFYEQPVSTLRGRYEST